MSVEFFGSCDPRFVPTPGALVDELMVRGIILRAYGPFPGSGAHTVLCFAEGGVRGFSLRIEEERVPVELLFRQNVLPSLADWRCLLSAMQRLLSVPSLEIRDEDGADLTHETLEDWKAEAVYRERHVWEIQSLLASWETGADTFTIPTYPYDLKIGRQDVDSLAPAESQFDRIQSVLLAQVEHFESCFEPSIMTMQDQAGREYRMITWTPAVPTLAWEVDVVSLGAAFFGRFLTIAFRDLIAALGPRARVIGSVTAGIKRYELPALDFSRPKDQKLRAKIVSLKPFFMDDSQPDQPDRCDG